MPTMESPIAGSLLGWKDIKVAMSNAMNKGVHCTMEECMQAAVIAKLFPGLAEGEQLLLRSKIIKIEPIFEQHAIAHVGDLMNQYDIDKNAPGGKGIEEYWRASKDIMKLVLDIAGFEEFMDGALKLFSILLERTAGNLCLAYVMSEVTLAFDETLLQLSKKLLELRGVTALQLWRARVFDKPIDLTVQKCNSRAFLYRSTHFMAEACIPTVLGIVTNKVTEGRVPPELVDMIYAHGLEEHDMPRHTITQSIWEPIKDPQEASSGSPCCILKQRYRPDQVMLWSRAERQYMLFHVLSVIFLRERLANPRFDQALASLNLKDENMADIYVRCKGQHPDSCKLQLEWERFEDFPPEVFAETLFEIGHGLNREWR